MEVEYTALRLLMAILRAPKARAAIACIGRSVECQNSGMMGASTSVWTLPVKTEPPIPMQVPSVREAGNDSVFLAGKKYSTDERQ